MVRFDVAAADICDALHDKLLKLIVPVPLIEEPGPLIAILPVLPLKVPLLTQLPVTA